MKKITINDRGVFLTETYPLSPFAIEKKRRQIQLEILRLKRDIQDAEILITNKQKQILNSESTLKDLLTPFVEAFIQKAKQERLENYEKAQKLLQECIGDDLFKVLQERKRIIFMAKDGMTYKLKITGAIYRKIDKEWRQLCIIRPTQLPFPDFLLSLFTSVREKPQSYTLRRR
jgi:predicted DCC family thiol-disulfide oxidoreductase YuxK